MPKPNINAKRNIPKKPNNKIKENFDFFTVDLPFAKKPILGGIKPVGCGRPVAIRYHSADENPDR